MLAVTGTVLLSYNQKLETTAEISTVISAYFVYAREFPIPSYFIKNIEFEKCNYLACPD